MGSHHLAFTMFISVGLIIVIGLLVPSNEEGCCLQKVVSGDPVLDGSYSLLEERSVETLTSEDQALCVDGCIYSKTGSPSSAEYCFKPGSLQSVCSSITSPPPSPQNALLERGDILQNMKVLNQSQELKSKELGQTKELTEDIEAAEDKIKQITSSSGRKARQVEECEAIVVYIVAMENYTATNDTTKMQEMANNIINAEATSCPDYISSKLEESLQVFSLTKMILNDIIKSLEAEIKEIQSTIQVLGDELFDIEQLLVTEFGVDLDDASLDDVDASEEMPHALDPATALYFDFALQFSEMPVALDFPVIDIAQFSQQSLY